MRLARRRCKRFRCRLARVIASRNKYGNVVSKCNCYNLCFAVQTNTSNFRYFVPRGVSRGTGVPAGSSASVRAAAAVPPRGRWDPLVAQPRGVDVVVVVREQQHACAVVRVPVRTPRIGGARTGAGSHGTARWDAILNDHTRTAKMGGTAIISARFVGSGRFLSQLNPVPLTLRRCCCDGDLDGCLLRDDDGGGCRSRAAASRCASRAQYLASSCCH